MSTYQKRKFSISHIQFFPISVGLKSVPLMRLEIIFNSILIFQDAVFSAAIRLLVKIDNLSKIQINYDYSASTRKLSIMDILKHKKNV